MRWKFISQWSWSTCISNNGADKKIIGGGGGINGVPPGTENLPRPSSTVLITTTNKQCSNSEMLTNGNGITPNNGEGADDDETDLIAISVTNDTLKRWSVGSTINSDGDYSKVVVQFGNEIDDSNDHHRALHQHQLSLEKILGWETTTTNNVNSRSYDPGEPVPVSDQNSCIISEFDLLRNYTGSNKGSTATTLTMRADSSLGAGAGAEVKAEKSDAFPTVVRNGSVHFAPEIKPRNLSSNSTPTGSAISRNNLHRYSRVQFRQNDLSAAGPGKSQASPENSFLSSLSSPSGSAPTENNNTSFEQLDKWRVLFDQFDAEGFGEIPWVDFLEIVLPSPQFVQSIEPGKLEVLRDLAIENIRRASTKVATTNSAITFQYFVNIMSGKRSRSFKCAVHHRDREVSSENDFHIILPTLGNTASSSQNEEIETALLCTPNRRQKLAKRIAEEFLTDSRDRKYFSDHYECFPPPVFIPVLSLIQIGFFAYYKIYHDILHSKESNNSSSSSIMSSTSTSASVTYLYTPLASDFVYSPHHKNEIWRFVLYALLHSSWPHFIFNLLVQLLIGLPLGMLHGSLRIFIIYVIGVIGSSLTTSIFDPHANLIGASGGVYALLTAYLANSLLNYNQMIRFGIGKLLLILIFASVDVGITIYNRYIAIFPSMMDLEDDDDEGFIVQQDLAPISYLGHITGAIIGLNIGLVILRNFEQSLHQQLIWWFTFSIFCTWILFTILINLFKPDDLIM